MDRRDCTQKGGLLNACDLEVQSTPLHFLANLRDALFLHQYELAFRPLGHELMIAQGSEIQA